MRTIELVNGKGTVLADDEDYAWLKQFNWYLGARGHAITRIWDTELKKQRTHSMHRMVMDAYTGDGKIIDHINGNPLDNRKENLRDGGVSANMRNRRKIPGSNKVKFKGVRKRENGYVAVLWLGLFDTPEEAAQVYDNAVRILFPDYPVNFPVGDWERSAIKERRGQYITN